jgi:putative ABC transport system permease protein
MDIINLCQQILDDMWSRKLRSLLALFGIIWGTAAVILLMSVGHSFIVANQDKIENLASGTLIYNSGSSSQPYLGYPIDHPVTFKAKQIMKLSTIIPHIEHLTVDMDGVSTDIRYGDHHKNSPVRGVGRDFAAMNKATFTPDSRNFSPRDVSQSRNVLILGSSAAKRLFGNRPAVGQHVKIHSSIAFLVIGVMQPNTSNTSLNGSVLLPYTTYINIWDNRNINFFEVQPDKGFASQVNSGIRSYLGNRFHFNPNDQEALSVFDTTAFAEFFRWFFMAIEIFLGLCGALTLGVGGVGVANIMFLIVTERTREIGLRMAVGARDWQVMSQIILEACMIVGIGGIIGFLLSLLLVSLLQLSHLPSWVGHPTMSWISVFSALIILALVAILSGYFPGRNAARLDPVDALRK